MSWRFLEEKSTADVAFRADGRTLEELFASAADAVVGTMVSNPLALGRQKSRTVELSAESVEMLLFDFLQAIIFHKDAERLLLRVDEVSTRQSAVGWSCTATLRGEIIDSRRQDLLADVKAVTLQGYLVARTPAGWMAEVVLDV